VAGFKIARKLIWAGCISLLVASSVSAQEFRIEPGRRIGKVALGKARGAVHRMLGKPSATYRVGGGVLTGDVWMADTGNDVRVIYYRGVVIQIKVTSPRFSTSDELTTNSSLAEVKKKHPNLRKTRHFVHGSGGGLIEYYDDVERGIAFEFTSVASETTNFKPYAIIVHRAGKPVIPENDEDVAEGK
jgi:hypothetical protein